MEQNYTFKFIGKIQLGVDGCDEFYEVTCDEDIDSNALHNEVHSKSYRETYAEAGGYYCKHFEVFTNPIFSYRAVVKIEHRYDV
jgi:hypothetical protein